MLTQGANWQEVAECFDNVSKPSYKVSMLRLTIGTFWWTGRFGEARKAADYWASMMKEEASHHREEFRETLQLLRKTSDWYLGRGGGNVEGMEQFAVLRETAKKKGYLVRTYRDAHLTQAYLKWSEKHGDTAATEYLLQHPEEIRIGFLLGSFDLKARLARELGVPSEVFDKMCKDAEKLSNLPNSAG